nr:hypothetical protein [Planctomycetota bacterium]
TVRFPEGQAVEPVSKKEAVPPRPDRAQRDEVLNDPAVQIILKALDATPVDIQKIQAQEPQELEEEMVDEA